MFNRTFNAVCKFSESLWPFVHNLFTKWFFINDWNILVDNISHDISHKFHNFYCSTEDRITRSERHFFAFLSSFLWQQSSISLIMLLFCSLITLHVPDIMLMPFHFSHRLCVDLTSVSCKCSGMSLKISHCDVLKKTREKENKMSKATLYTLQYYPQILHLF